MSIGGEANGDSGAERWVYLSTRALCHFRFSSPLLFPSPFPPQFLLIAILADMAPAKATTTSKRDKPPSEHTIKTLVASGLTTAQVKAMSPNKRNSLVLKAQTSARDLKAAIGKATGGQKGKKSQSTSDSFRFRYQLRLLQLLTPLASMFIIEALDNADAEKNAAKVLKKLQTMAATVKKGKPPGLSKQAMADILEDRLSDVEEDESGDDEGIELQSRPKASHGRSFSGECRF